MLAMKVFLLASDLSYLFSVVNRNPTVKADAEFNKYFRNQINCQQNLFYDRKRNRKWSNLDLDTLLGQSVGDCICYLYNVLYCMVSMV